jgi:hypothetical protein
MCDYSIAAVRTRLALEGEELEVCRFPGGSLGLTTPAERERYQREDTGWRSWFTSPTPPCAVCIPPGARLVLVNISPVLQRSLRVSPTECVTFAQTSILENQHRDAIVFRNWRQVSLQQLPEGQQIVVLTLSAREETRDLTQASQTVPSYSS